MGRFAAAPLKSHPMSNDPNAVITRFAPSPTGHLHIGGARTALLCWAYAMRHDGRFLLRIEDTDQNRSSESSTKGILEDLAWLGIDWADGPELNYNGRSIGGDTRSVGPYFQAQRLDIYNEYITKLIESDHAYPAFETPEELEEKRKVAIEAKVGYKYDRAALDIPREQRMQRLAAGEPHVVRLKMPEDPITVHDQILGDVTVGPDEFDDFIIRKRDGFPTYHLAVVVDDALMGVTHVLRGQEHLINTPRHIAIQQALGFDSPTYAHMPLIFNPDGSKMSKRDKDKAAKKAVKEHKLSSDEGINLLAHRMEIARTVQRSSATITSDAYVFEIEYYARFVAREVDNPKTIHDVRTKVSQAVCPSYAWGHPPRSISPKLFDRAKSDILSVLDTYTEEQYNQAIQIHTEQLRTWFKDKKNQIDSSYVLDMAALYDVYLPEIDVEDFRRAGYLPEALNNYLALLGWNPKAKNADGTDVERFDMEYLATHYGFEGMGKAQAKFDRVKLLSFNADTIAELSDDEFATRWRQWATSYDPALCEKFSAEDMSMLAPAVKTRCKTLADGRSVIGFAFIDDDAIEYDGKDLHKALLKGDAKGLEMLKLYRAFLGSIDPFTPESIEQGVKDFCEKHEVGMGKVAQPIRIAVTGGPVSPPLGQTLAIIGKAAVGSRIDRCITHAEQALATKE